MMLRLLFIVAYFAILLFSQSYLLGQAPNLKLFFNHLTEDNGLSEPHNAFISKDSKGYVWIGSFDGLNRFNGVKVESFKADLMDPFSISNNIITSRCFEDKYGNLWFSANDAINCYVRKTNRFNSFPLKDNKGDTILADYSSFHLDQQGNLWTCAGGNEKGELHLFNIYTLQDTILHPMVGQRFSVLKDENGNVRQILSSLLIPDPGAILYTYNEQLTIIDEQLYNLGDAGSKKGVITYGSYLDAKNLAWVGVNAGLVKLELDKPEMESPTLITDYLGHDIGMVWSIIPYNEHFLFVASQKEGLLIFDKTIEAFVDQYKVIVGDANSINSNTLNELMLDEEDNLWISIYGKGVDFCNLGKNKFSPQPIKCEDNRTLTNVSSMQETASGEYLIGTTKGKVYALDREQEEAVELAHEDSESTLKGNTIRLFKGNDNRIWGTENTRLFYINSNKKIELVHQFEGQINFFVQFKSGRILVSTHKGIFEVVLTDQGKTVEPFHELASYNERPITYAFQDKEERIYFSANVSECEVYKEENNQFVFRNKIPSLKYIWETYEEPGDSILWLNSSEGFGRLNKETLKFETKGGEEAKTMLFGLLADDKGNFWLSNTKGLFKYDRKEDRLKLFNLSDGILPEGIERYAYMKAANGEMWFGGPQGINIFHPDSIKLIKTLPKIQLSSFKVNEKDYEAPDATQISEIRFFNLAPNENNLSFEFVGMEYSDPASITYQYQMEGLDDDWVSTSNNTARYPKVPHGDYTFKVKAANSDGVWSEPFTIQIKIRPRFYQTIWFALLCIAVLLASFWLLYRDQLRKRLRIAENEKLKELDEFKSRFFTHITHEFRTPLNIIKGYVEIAIKEGNQLKPSNLQVMRQNAGKLFTLVNQILELRKLESVKVPVQYSKGDVVSFGKDTLTSVQRLAEGKGIKLVFSCALESLVLFFDEGKLNTILTNFLSNAIKFTDRGGQITLEVGEDNGSLKCSVKDTGTGIPKDKLPFVFDRFYQAHENDTGKFGSGIGLALCKELAKVMGGEVKAESEVGQGSCFSVILPRHETSPNGELLATPIDQKATEEETTFDGLALDLENRSNLIDTLLMEAEEGEEGSPVILLVEDNFAFQGYISEMLRPHFRLEISSDGAEGLAKAKQLIPDLIISDVKMPQMDGYELTEILKNDPLTGHIPIILLTGLEDLDSRLTGISHGVDVYLNKSFNQDELLLWINNLLRLRNRLQQVYSGMDASENVAKSSDPDLVFVKNVNSIVAANYQNDSFNVEELAKLLGMTYISFLRKFKAVTGKRPAAHIQDYRISKAKELLVTQRDLKISEIAYMVGYAEPSHFTRKFREVVGMSPSEYREKEG
ncbi:MAG: ATP-binding protein [Saprospiraceae bacterium]